MLRDTLLPGPQFECFGKTERDRCHDHDAGNTGRDHEGQQEVGQDQA
jgi:hypothetical protein